MNYLEIKENRKKLGLTQEELGKKLGVSKRTIINYEKGEIIPDTKLDILSSIFDSLKKEQNSKSLFIGKNKDISIKDFVDVFFKYKEDIENDERMKEYKNSIEKDAIIKYQHLLLTETKKNAKFS